MTEIMGKRKAAVLPEPVCAHAMMSKPAHTAGKEQASKLVSVHIKEHGTPHVDVVVCMQERA
eukprot:2528635-Rhodomonas_salina.1